MVVRDDGELLRSWAGGDKGAGGELFARHSVAVYRFLRRKLSDPDTAKDLTQRTFLTCVENVERWGEDIRFRAFILGIARNLWLHHVRGAGREAARMEKLAHGPAPSITSPSAAAARGEEEKLLLLALRRLPMELQMTLELYYWEELTTREIGDVLEIPPGTVKWRLSRARELLREEVENAAVSPSVRESTLGDLEGWARRVRDHAIDG